MQPFVRVQHHNIALLFSQYLHSQNIASEVNKVEGGFDICCQENDAETATNLFKEFIANPQHPKYQSQAWQQSKVVDVESQEGLVTSAKRSFLAHAGPVTLSVFAICWLVWLSAILGFGDKFYQAFRFSAQLTTETIFSEIHKLITPAFLHFSWLHIVFNTLWWWELGGTIEKRFSKSMLLVILIVSALMSNVGQFLVSGPYFGGLSGVVYALFGFVWWSGWLMPEKGIGLSKPIIGFMLFWMLIGFANLLPVNMANTAHLLGLVSGCGLAWIFAKRKGA